LDKNHKKRVLFIGSFIKVNKDGGTGGQLYACTSLLESELSNYVDWILIDSSTKLPVPGFTKRVLKALKRIVRSIYHILFSKVDTLLIFTADGFSFYEKGAVALFGKFCGKKVIIAPRSGFIINDLKKKYSKKYMAYVFKKVNVILCQGQTWKDLFEDSFPKIDKSNFIIRRNWINTASYKIKKKERTDKGVLSMLFVGWVDKAKGIEDLINSFSYFETEKVKLYIGGNGSYYEEARQLVKDKGLSERIIFLDWIGQEEKMRRFQMADVFILPSHFEGMPNAIMEAISAALPVIATNVGGIPDMIQEGVNGFLIEKEKPKQIAAKINCFLEDSSLLDKMAKESEALALKNHDISGAVNLFREILK